MTDAHPRPRAEPLRVVVTGWITAFPVAGLLWHVVSYALGMRELGHDVWLLDDTGDEPWAWDLARGEEDPTHEVGLAFVDRELGALDLADRFALWDQQRGRYRGRAAGRMAEVLASADVLVNVSMVSPVRDAHQRIPVRLGIDTDPVFTQIRMRSGLGEYHRMGTDHTHLLTFGRGDLPAAEHDWIPTRQPVSLAAWPAGPPPDPGAPLSTIASWKAYPPVEWDGVQYGVKDQHLEALASLPRLAGGAWRIALAGGAGAPAASLTAAGWDVVNPAIHTTSTGAYRRLMEDSTGEIGIAKHGYVAARSGWFSERSCCYLATGRGVLHQRTGWEDWLPEGEGLLGWSSVEEAVEAAARLRADPVRHGKAARALVEDHFDARRVCAELLEVAS